MLPSRAIVMMKNALSPAGIQIHIVLVLAGQGGGKIAEQELFSLPICRTARAGLTRGLSTGTLQERGGRLGRTAFRECPSVDTASSI